MAKRVFRNNIVQAGVALVLLLLFGVYVTSPAGQPSAATTTAPTLFRSARAAQDIPQPEPLLFTDIDPQSARQINAAIPFSTAPLHPARPFAFAGDEASREKAVDCLAAAMWYEAGNDDIGQRAVGQVVLNRVRHPAFPASVCGVVFQGSERVTGCQFTFTCDGALRRTPSTFAWSETRARARAALAGDVYAPVGLATHYHTDWVHPVWSAKLEKIAEVHTQLFFRWSGEWGQPTAMSQSYAGREAPIAKLARLSLPHRSELSEEQILLADAQIPPAVAIASLAPASVVATAPLSADNGAVATTPEGVHFLQAPGRGSGGPLAMQALNICGDQKFCKVVGWAEGRSRGNILPASSADREAVAFLYIRDRRTGVDRAFWDCARFERQATSQCLGADRARWIDFNGNFQSDQRSDAQNI